MKPINPIICGDVRIGDGAPPVFMAEIGTLFNQNETEAETIIRATMDAGARLMKGEVLHDPDVVLSDTGLTTQFIHTGGTTQEDYRALIERKVLPLDTYRRLFGICTDAGVPFVASVYDFAAVDFLVDIGAAGIKIASPNIVHIPLIRHAAATGLPLMIDTGKATLDEVTRAVDTALEAGAGGVLVNHNPDGHPAPPAAHHMRIMQSYATALGVPVGLSCHHVGDELLYLAVGMGAHLLEKPIAADPTRAEQDTVFALDVGDVGDVIRKIENCWLAIGQAPRHYDAPRDLSGRPGLVAARDLSVGDQLDLTAIRFAWPPLGIGAEFWDTVSGKSLAKAVSADSPVQWADIDFDAG